LDETVAGFFAEAAEDDAARVNEFALGGGDGEETELRIRAPVAQERTKVIGQITTAQKRDCGVIGVEAGERIGG